MTASALKNTMEVQRLGFMKDSFGYKMSKKVAELTQVVHMLFSRNHEREVELDALRAAYEEETYRVIKEAKNNNEKLEYLLRDATRQRQREVVQAADNTALLLKETQERMETMKQDLAEEKIQTLKFRDLLSQTQKELERTKQGTNGVSESLEYTNQKLGEREAELTKLKSLYKKVQEQLKTKERDLDEIKMRLGHSNERVDDAQNVIHRLNKSLEESNKNCDEITKKLLQVEEELKISKRELKKKSKEKSTSHFQRSGVSASRQTERNKDDEMENLRREVERLRMELSNREGNFNRVFAKFQPVYVSSDSNNQRHQNNRMMMVTPAPIEPDTSRKLLSNGPINPVRSGIESPFSLRPPPSPVGLHYSSSFTKGVQNKPAGNNVQFGLDSSKLNGGTRNVSPTFRLVYSK